MAMSTRASTCTESGSDMYYDYTCSSCTEDGRHVEASKSCVQCQQDLCAQCLKNHNKFVGLKDHLIVDKSRMRSEGARRSPSPLLTEKCKKHVTEVVNMYCGLHDQVCCGTCIATEHGSCQGVNYLPIAAQSYKPGPETNTVTDSIEEVKNELHNSLKIRKDNLKRIDNGKISSLKEIDEFKENANARLNEKVERAKNEVCTKHTSMISKTNTDIETLTDMIQVLDTNAKQIDSFKENNETMFFLFVKQGKSNETEARSLIKDVEADGLGRETLHYSIDSEVKDYFLNLDSIGDIDGIETKTKTTENKPDKSAKLIGEYNVKVTGDKRTCNITELHLLNDGYLVISDLSNNALKLLDKTYKVVDRCTLNNGPTNICGIGQEEIAVALPHIKGVQFVSVQNKSLTVTGSIKLRVTCTHIAYSCGELIVLSGGVASQPSQIGIYSLSGDLLRSFPTGELVRHPCHVAVSRDGARLHVIDKDRGVITTDRQGNHLWRFNDPNLLHACASSVGIEDDLFVCGLETNNILHIDGGGRKLGEVLTWADGLNSPRGQCYNRGNQTLAVAMYKTNIIKVYKLLRN